MDAASWMLTQLDQATRMHHAPVEAAQLAFLQAPSVAGYRDELIRIYGFEAPVESALAMAPDLPGIDLRERSKSGALAGDLLALGVRPQQLAKLPLCPRAESFDTPEVALGWLYVVERRTLRSDVLRVLTRTLGDIVEQASGYLRSYEGIAETRWRDLGRALDRLVTPESVKEVITAAHHAFWCERDWFHRDPVRKVG
jgi:heme oxygenase (biliverdin-IX-beta and delta-forming)